MFEKSSNKIKVEVHPQYVKEQSDPTRGIYYFSYRVTITNMGEDSVQLLRRHWIIVDGSGHVEEVEGSGVVGLQPVILPGQVFEYSSFCPLPTPTGTMKGSYFMSMENGSELQVEIPLFVLCEPSYYH